MTRSDPAYAYLVEDARQHGYPSTCDNPEHLRPRRSCPNCKLLDDYFREIGVEPPADYKRLPLRSSYEIPQHDDLERLAASPTWSSRYSIYKSWGEPGATITVTRNGHDEGDQ